MKNPKPLDGLALVFGATAGLAVSAAVWEWLDTCVMRSGEGAVEAATRCARTSEWGYDQTPRRRRQ